MQNNKALSLLGLCMKAGKVKSGAFAATDAIKSFKACFVIIAADASNNSKKEFTNMCSFYEVPYWIYSDKENLGRAIGKEERTVVAVCDEGFASSFEKIRSQLESSGKVSE